MASSKTDLEIEVPTLAGEPYDITSDPTIRYNCFAFALHETFGWLDPQISPGNYWPDEVRRERTLSAYVKVYEKAGFVECPDGIPEPGYEKVALYLDADDEPSHAARLLASGLWVSKLGREDDIEHERLSSLAGPNGFGEVACYLKREKA